MSVRWLDENLSATDMGDGRYFVKNHETGEERFLSAAELASLIRSGAKSEDHVALGDAVHEVASFFGISGCVSCAERQRKMNRWVKKWK